MKKLRNWLTLSLGLNLIVAIIGKWHIVSKISVIINSVALISVVTYDLIKLTDKNKE